MRYYGVVVGVLGGLPPVHGLVRQADHQSIAVSEAASVAVLRKTENLRKPEVESPPAGDPTRGPGAAHDGHEGRSR